jgi:hypothetical protein
MTETLDISRRGGRSTPRYALLVTVVHRSDRGLKIIAKLGPSWVHTDLCGPDARMAAPGPGFQPL